MTARQERFVQEYLIDLNATQAAIRAGYGPKWANRQAHLLLDKNRHIAEEIARRKQAIKEKSEIDLEALTRQQIRFAFTDLREVFTWDREGNITMKSSEEISGDAAQALAEVTQIKSQTTTKDGKTKIRTTLRVKMQPKQPALNALCERFGWFPQKQLKHSGHVDVNHRKIDWSKLPEHELKQVADLYVKARELTA